MDIFAYREHCKKHTKCHGRFRVIVDGIQLFIFDIFFFKFQLMLTIKTLDNMQENYHTKLQQQTLHM